MGKRISALLMAMVIAMQLMFTVAAFADVQEGDLSDYENAISASSSETGNYPINTIDGNLGTKWAAEGIGQWLCFRLSEETVVEEIGFSFTSGSVRVYSFSVEVSMDMENWTVVFEGESCGTTDGIEMFKLKPEKAKFLRFVGKGSNVNIWNNINEVSGITLKRTPIKLAVDGRTENFPQEPVADSDSILVPARSLLERLKFTCGYDEATQVFTAEKGECAIRFDYMNGSASVNGSSISKDGALTLVDGTPMMQYDLLRGVLEAEISYDTETKTVNIVTDEYVWINEAYDRIDAEFLGVLDWLVEIYDPETGGFYNTISGANYEGFYPSLEATAYVYQIMTTLGAASVMPEKFKQKLIHFFQSCQDPDTGFFAEPWEKANSYNDRDKSRVYGVVVDKLKQLGAAPLYPLPSERTEQSAEKRPVIVINDESEVEAAALEEELAAQTDDLLEAFIEDTIDEVQTEEQPAEEIENREDEVVAPVYDPSARISLPAGVPSYCASVNQFIDTIASRNWYNDVWSAGDKAYEDLSYILMLDKSVQQPYIDAAIEWLNNQQNPETGYWNDSGDIGFNAVSGAFKVARIYDRFGISPPNPMLIAETILKTLRSDATANAACYVRNPISTLEILMRYDSNVQAFVQDSEVEIVELYEKMMKAMFHADGGASSNMYQSDAKFGGLRTGRIFCEGNVDGTLQMTIARVYVSTVFNRKVNSTVLTDASGEFWQRLMAKPNIVKKPYTAEPGVLIEQDFEDCESIDDLFDQGWSFNAANTVVRKESTGNTYLVADDTIPLDLETWRLSFDKIYGAGEIEFSAMLDRGNYGENGNDMSYSFIDVRSAEDMIMQISALDSGSEKVTLALSTSQDGVTTYHHFATVDRGKWFDLKLAFTRDKMGMLHMQCYLNGKLQPAATDVFLVQDAEYICAIEGRTSASRCSKVGVDNVKIIVL